MVISQWLKIKLVKLLKKKNKTKARYMHSGTPPSSPLGYSQVQRAKERLHISFTIYSLELRVAFPEWGKQQNTAHGICPIVWSQRQRVNGAFHSSSKQKLDNTSNGNRAPGCFVSYNKLRYQCGCWFGIKDQQPNKSLLCSAPSPD